MSSEIDACVRMWAVVVQTAVTDLFSREDHVRLVTNKWFMSDGRDVGTFLWCCDVLDLDPIAVREGVRNGELQMRRTYRRIVRQFRRHASHDEDPSQEM